MSWGYWGSRKVHWGSAVCVERTPTRQSKEVKSAKKSCGPRSRSRSRPLSLCQSVYLPLSAPFPHSIRQTRPPAPSPDKSPTSPHFSRECAALSPFRAPIFPGIPIPFRPPATSRSLFSGSANSCCPCAPVMAAFVPLEARSGSL